MFRVCEHHPVNLPWGPDATVGLELPPGLMEFELDTLWPNLEGSVGDYPAALEAAPSMLPRSRRRWSELVKAGSPVAIVVDDPSRWTPVHDALPIVLGGSTRRGFASTM